MSSRCANSAPSAASIPPGFPEFARTRSTTSPRAATLASRGRRRPARRRCRGFSGSTTSSRLRPRPTSGRTSFHFFLWLLLPELVALRGQGGLTFAPYGSPWRSLLPGHPWSATFNRCCIPAPLAVLGQPGNVCSRRKDRVPAFTFFASGSPSCSSRSPACSATGSSSGIRCLRRSRCWWVFSCSPARAAGSPRSYVIGHVP